MSQQAEKPRPFRASAWISLIILWEQYRCRGARGFGNDPEFLLGPVVIDREDSRPVDQGLLVTLPILFSAVTPVAVGMTVKRCAHVDWMDRLLCCRGD